VVTEFREGDQVLLRNFRKSNKAAGTTKKMNPVYNPVTVVARHGNSYELEKLSGEIESHNIINLHHLTKPTQNK